MWGASVVQSLCSASLYLTFNLQQITIQIFYVYVCTNEKNLIHILILLLSACIHTNIVECLDCDLLEG